jgi:AsmA protein
MIKTFLKVFAGLVVLIVIAIAGFIYTFDANNYREEITELAESVTGRPISIAGDMDISLYPWIGIKINDVTIENTPAFSNKTFATIGQFDVRIKVMPLLQKRLDIDRLVLHRLVANFEMNTAGENNWSDVAVLSDADDMKSEFGLASLSVGGIDLADSSLSWEDVNTGKQFKISKMNLSTQAINQGQPLPVELKALVESNQPEWMAAIHAKTKLEFNDDAAVFDANGLKMSVKALLPGTEMGKVTIAMVADSTINLQTQTARLTKARLSAFGLVAGGTFDIENIFSVPIIQGPIRVKTFEMATLAKHLKFDMPQMTNAPSLNQISLKALFKTDFDTVQLDDIVAKVDASRVQGFVHIAAKSQPEVRYELKADKINLDDYRLAGNEADKDKLPLPLDFIRAADLEGVLDIETAMLDEIELKQLHIASNIENSILKINPVTMLVSDAEVKAAVQLDAREIPAVILTAEVRQVDANDSINPLLNNIMGDQAPTLKGLVDANANLNATGSSVAALKTSAKGTVQLAMDEITVTGIDFDHASQAVVVDYAERNDFKVSRTFNAEYVPDSATEFNRLSASFKLSKGKLVNNDLLMESDKVNVTGSGSIDFINARLDYRPVIDMNMKSTVNVRDKLRDHPMQYHAYGRFGDLITEFDVALYDLHMGRLMIQEAKAHTNRRINSQSQNNWQNVLSK